MFPASFVISLSKVLVCQPVSLLTWTELTHEMPDLWNVSCVVISPKVILQKSEVESMVHSPGDHILLSADKYEIKVILGGDHFWYCSHVWAAIPEQSTRGGANTVFPLQVWPLGREINCKCLKTLSVSEDRSISLQPRLQFDGRYIVCSSDLGVYQWDFASFEILR